MTLSRVSGWVRLLRAWGVFWSAGCLAGGGVLLFGTFGSNATPDPAVLWPMSAEARFLTVFVLLIFAFGAAFPVLCTWWRGGVAYAFAVVVLASVLLLGVSLMEASRLTLADAGSGVLAVELALFLARPVRRFVTGVE